MAIWSPFCHLFKLELASVEWEWMDLRRVQRFDFFIFHYAKCVQVEWNENNFSCYPASWAQIEQKITNKVERWRRSVDDMNKMQRRLCGCHGAGNDCHRLLAEQWRESEGARSMGHMAWGTCKMAAQIEMLLPQWVIFISIFAVLWPASLSKTIPVRLQHFFLICNIEI